MTTCRHCGSPVPPDSTGGDAFCCHGCQSAHALIHGLGLDRYYERRELAPDQRPPKPEEEALDVSAYVRAEAEGGHRLDLMVDGLHCAACVWLIETVLGREPDVTGARLNMTTRRLTLRWEGPAERAQDLVDRVRALGYRVVPFDPTCLAAGGDRQGKELLRCLAVAGFAAGNVMLLSVSIWAGLDGEMGPGTRTLFYWVQALIALPAILYAGRPFYRSALRALRVGRTNMDVPISLAVLLTAGMSVFQTIQQAEHAYFDSAIALLFFLLIGRVLDHQARGRARSAAEQLLALGATSVTVLDDDDTRRVLPPNQVQVGMTMLVAAGERVGVDGEVTAGRSDVDTSLISGESVPRTVQVGDRVFAGMVNATAPLTCRVTAVGEDTLLSEIVRMMEVAEQGRARHVALADRVARLYAPLVHSLAAVTFAGWMLLTAIDWQTALLYAVSVLVITCPCALALAVPAVQVIATGRLLRQGTLLKTGTALERLRDVDTVVFDKTGTLTLGKPKLGSRPDPEDLDLAASLAGASRHPLARALAAATHVPVAHGVHESPGQGLEWTGPDGPVRLGSRDWCGITDPDDDNPAGPALWLRHPDGRTIRFDFVDPPRPDAAEAIGQLRARGLDLMLLSGDRPGPVAAVAGELGIDDFQAGCSPADKCARLAELAETGRKVLMVGDGLNDAPALAAAHVSVSPASAVDISQVAADAVFQGDRLAPVPELLRVAHRADRLVYQNFTLSFVYNVVTIPLAVAGYVTPLIAAIAMSSSSLMVIANALRLGRRR